MFAPSRSRSRKAPGLTVGSSMKSQIERPPPRRPGRPGCRRGSGSVADTRFARPWRSSARPTTNTISAPSQTIVYTRMCLNAGMKRKSSYVRTKLSKPTQPPSDVREGELERVDRRRDAEDDQKRQVRQDERQAARDVEATRSRGLHVLRGRGRRAQVATCSRPCTRPPSRCSRDPRRAPAAGR